MLQEPKRSRAEPILYVGVIVTCSWVMLSLLLGYSGCGSASITGLIYLMIFTLGAIVWVPALIFGLLIHATTTGKHEGLQRVAVVFLIMTAAIWVIEAQVYPNAEKTASRCSL